MVPNNDAGVEIRLYTKLRELLNTYETAKRFIFLSEYYNKNHSISISVINELRNALDHVMRAIKSKELVDDEIRKAEGHLYRSAFDACEVIVINRLNYIYSFKEKYNLGTLNTIYPQYYKEYLPLISAILEDLAHLRSVEISSERLQNYEAVVSKLIEICDVLDKNLTDNLQIKTQTKFKDILSGRIVTVILGTIALFASIMSAFGEKLLNKSNIILYLSTILLGVSAFLILRVWRIKKK